MQLPVLYYSVLYCTVLQFTGLVCTQYLLVTFLHPRPARVRNIKQTSGYKQLAAEVSTKFRDLGNILMVVAG